MKCRIVDMKLRIGDMKFRIVVLQRQASGGKAHKSLHYKHLRHLPTLTRSEHGDKAPVSTETRLLLTPTANAHPIQQRASGLPDKPINVIGGLDLSLDPQ